MLTKPVIVALKSNEDQIGYCISEQILTIQSLNKQTNEIQTDFVSKLGVCWEDDEKRCPAIHYHDPEELVWFDIDGLSIEENKETTENTLQEEIIEPKEQEIKENNEKEIPEIKE